jgi:glycosyltransferase involved in cell wall biosynthesis
VLTQRRRDALAAEGCQGATVVPCVVDTSVFSPDPPAGRQRRDRLGLRGLVFVYAGKASGWYLRDSMLDFVAAAQEVVGETCLLVLTSDPPDAFSGPAAARGIHCVVRKVPRADVPAFLSAADVALSFRRPGVAAAACSPVKNAEYLACGLPIVTTAGIGDYSDLIEERQVGIVVPVSDSSGYRESVAALARLLRDPGLRARCRELADTELSLASVAISRYREVYQRLLGPPREERE